MLRLSTRAKLRVARQMFRAVQIVRRLARKTGTRVVCERRGIRWQLDLTEGIDLSIYLFGGFERETRKTIARHVGAGENVIDVGANIGAHTLPMARHVAPGGRVIAFEATEWAFCRLRDNLALNPRLASNVDAVHALLGDGRTPAPASVCSSWSVLGFESAAASHGGTAHPLGGARLTTLDGYVMPLELTSLGLIKIDVDGFEPGVLGGAAAVLERFRPKLLVELCPDALLECGASLHELLELIDRLGYELWDEPGRRPLGSPDEVAARIPRGGSVNALGRPRSARRV